MRVPMPAMIKTPRLPPPKAGVAVDHPATVALLLAAGINVTASHHVGMAPLELVLEMKMLDAAAMILPAAGCDDLERVLGKKGALSAFVGSDVLFANTCRALFGNPGRIRAAIDAADDDGGTAWTHFKMPAAVLDRVAATKECNGGGVGSSLDTAIHEVLDHIIAASERCDMDLTEQADFNGSRQGRTGIPLLHYAARSGDRKSVGSLLKLGADITAVDPAGQNLLHRAVLQRDPGLARLVLTVAVETAETGDRTAKTKTLLDTKDVTGRTSGQYAADHHVAGVEPELACLFRTAMLVSAGDATSAAYAGCTTPAEGSSPAAPAVSAEAVGRLRTVLPVEIEATGFRAYGNFDIILDRFSRICYLHPTPYAPCATLYMVPTLIGC